jgi:hypothetical protein
LRGAGTIGWRTPRQTHAWRKPGASERFSRALGGKISLADIRCSESLAGDSLDSDPNRAREAQFRARLRKKFLHGESLHVPCIAAASAVRFAMTRSARVAAQNENSCVAEVLISSALFGTRKSAPRNMR